MGSPVRTLRGANADVLRIGHGFAPGIVTKGPTVKRAHDVQKDKGGGTSSKKLTTNGEKFAEVDIELTVYEGDPDEHDLALGSASHIENEIDRFWFLIGSLFPDGVPVDPFDVSHPILTLHRIKSILFESFTGPTPTGEVGVWTYTLKGTAFRPPLPKPKPASSTPTSSKPVDVNTKDGAAAAADAGIDKATAGLKKTFGGYASAAEYADAFEAWRKKYVAYLHGEGPNPGPQPAKPTNLPDGGG